MEEQYSNTRITNEYVYNTITNIDRENKICNDCGGAYPKYASINNGVVLCLSCTEKHRSLTNKVSFLRSLNDVWDDYLLLYLIRGGNSRFKLLMSKYRIQDDSAIEYKYKTKAAEYNRKSLRSEVLALEPPEELDVEIGNEISNECLNLYPEFEDMYVNSELENLSENADHEHCLSLSNKIKNTSKYLGESIGYLGHTIGNQLYHYSGRVKGKITSLNENYPVKILFNKTFKVLKIAGRYVIETSTPLIDSTCSYLKGNSNLDKEEDPFPEFQHYSVDSLEWEKDQISAREKTNQLEFVQKDPLYQEMDSISLSNTNGDTKALGSQELREAVKNYDKKNDNFNFKISCDSVTSEEFIPVLPTMKEIEEFDCTPKIITNGRNFQTN